MRRIVVCVDEVADGWRVGARVGTADGPLLAQYRMAATVLGARRVPATPPDRTPEPDLPHAALCAGDAKQLGGLLTRIGRGTPRTDDVTSYGRWLFECLMAPAWEAIRGHPDVSRDHAVELALRWPADASALHRLVWEAMRDPLAPLAGHPEGVFAITRLVPAPARPVRTVTGVPSVLFATSVALTDPTIRPGAMYVGLLREFDSAGRSRARAVAGVSPEDLENACRTWRPDLVHLVAHGVHDDGRAAVLLRGHGKVADRETDGERLLAALCPDGHRPLAVVLSACHSGSPGEDGPAGMAPLAAQLVAQGIPIVSAMAGEVRESACRLYSRRLAAAVHDGQPFVTASAHGRRAALIGAENADIDWALPALYLAEYVDPDLRLVDTTAAAAMIRLGAVLGLRQEPVFIGREDVLAAADSAVEPGSAVGVVLAAAKGSTSGLGGTRLLREIGWRVLRDGHVPLLLGPYQDPRITPTTSRGLVHAVLWQLVRVAELLELPPFIPLTLRFELGADGPALADEVRREVPSLARAAIRRALGRLLAGPGDVDPGTVRDLLADDLAELAQRAAATWGAPFGNHTRAVLLCDDVHAWAEPPPNGGPAPLTGLACLLAMLDATGLGRPDRHAPVVLTASTTLGAGEAVGTWSADGRPGFRFHPLQDLTPEERVIGYQWVLLHPWTTKPVEDQELFGAVYTSRPGMSAPWEATLRKVGGRPTSVGDRLYFAVDVALEHKSCRRDDDEGAWTSYVGAHPGYRL